MHAFNFKREKGDANEIWWGGGGWDPNVYLELTERILPL